jgi:hypothetical protein
MNTLLDRPEYMQLTLTIISQEIIDKYKLMDKEKMVKFTFELIPQAGRLANNLLVTRLAPHGYSSCQHTHGL